MFHQLCQMLASFLGTVPDPEDDALVDFLLARNGDRVARDQIGHLNNEIKNVAFTFVDFLDLHSEASFPREFNN